MHDTRVVLTSRSVAFEESDRLGRFDPTMPDEWHASPPQDCVISSPPRVVPSPPSSFAPQLSLSPREGLQVGHFDSDSADDDIPPTSLPPSPVRSAPPLLDHPQLSAPDLIPSRPRRTIRPNVRLPATDNVFPKQAISLLSLFFLATLLVTPNLIVKLSPLLMPRNGTQPFSQSTTHSLRARLGGLSVCLQVGKLSNASVSLRPSDMRTAILLGTRHAFVARASHKSMVLTSMRHSLPP
jgi:hypothetical protein